MSSPFFILERPSIPISLARSCRSFFDQSSYLPDLPPRSPALERPVLTLRSFGLVMQP